MCSVIAGVVLTLIAQGHAEELGTQHAGEAQDCMNLVERMLMAWPARLTNLDSATFAKTHLGNGHSTRLSISSALVHGPLFTIQRAALSIPRFPILASNSPIPRFRHISHAAPDAELLLSLAAPAAAAGLAGFLVLQQGKYKCNECGEDPIIGLRYTCCICDDYDLCAKCYARRSELHPQHDKWIVKDAKDNIRYGDIRDQMVKESKEARQEAAANAPNVSWPALRSDYEVSDFGREEVYDFGDPVRMLLGPAGELRPETVRVRRVLANASKVVTVQLEKPIGIDLEPIANGALCRVRALEEGGSAAAAARMAALSGANKFAAPCVGDVLLAVTGPVLAYDRSARVGLTKPRRKIVATLAANENCEGLQEALRDGLLADGPVTLVFERPLRAR